MSNMSLDVPVQRTNITTNDDVKQFVNEILVKQQISLLKIKLPVITNPQVSNAALMVAPYVSQVANSLTMSPIPGQPNNNGFIGGVESLVNNSTFYLAPIARVFNQINRP